MLTRLQTKRPPSLAWGKNLFQASAREQWTKILDHPAKKQGLHKQDEERQEGDELCTKTGKGNQFDTSGRPMEHHQSPRSCSSSSRALLHLMQRVVTGLALRRSILMSSPQSSQMP